MKLSIEARVAAAVATAFVALTMAAIGQEKSRDETDRLTRYGPTSNPSVNTNLSQQEHNGSLIAHTDTELDKGN
jgi:hypothetical protein